MTSLIKLTQNSFEDAPASKPEQPRISVGFGDGIGPEIMRASLKVLIKAGGNFEIEPVDIGEHVYRSGKTSGIGEETWDSLQRTKVFYKAPITTPQGGGYKSLNVTIRKTLGLYANVRPCATYAPFVPTRHPDMNVVIIRENEEDLYAGIEHRQTDDVYQCLKLISRPGCERIARYAFEYARAHGRRKVTCFTKDNIMKMTDGLFHRVFEEVAAGYPELESEHLIVDIGAALLADSPEKFDVVVLPNLYGDILSDVAAQLSGSIGMGASTNVGPQFAMFEAVHGSAPQLAGQDMANPSGLLLAGVMMMAHIGQPEIAEKVHKAWLKTLEDGLHTADIYQPRTFTRQVGTEEFADAVTARLGQSPKQLKPTQFCGNPVINIDHQPIERPKAKKALVGIDVFVHADGSADHLASELKACQNGAVSLSMITNRGVKVWPDGMPETFCTDHWRCRFMARPDKQFNKAMIVDLLRRFSIRGIDFIKTEQLYDFDGEPSYSLGQGQ